MMQTHSPSSSWELQVVEHLSCTFEMCEPNNKSYRRKAVSQLHQVEETLPRLHGEDGCIRTIAPMMALLLPVRVKKSRHSSSMAKIIHVEIEQGTNTDPKANGLLLRQKGRIEKEHLGRGRRGSLCTWLGIQGPLHLHASLPEIWHFLRVWM